MDEKTLILKSKAGDHTSFAALILPYEKKMFGLAFRMLKNKEDAEDAVQDAFLKAFSKLDTFREDSLFSTWLYTILHRICLDVLRKKKRTEGPGMVSLNQQSSDDEEYEIQVEDNAPGPYEQYKQRAANEVLLAAIEKLSDEQKAVVVLRDLQGLEYEEIARITKSSLGTVKSRLSRARLALRKILEENRELFL